MELTEDQKIAIAVDSAWEAFCDERSTLMELLRAADPQWYAMLQLAHAHGFTQGARHAYLDSLDTLEASK